MDKDKTRNNIEKVYIESRVYCGKKPISECSTTDCLLHTKTGCRCIKFRLEQISDRLQGL